MPLPSMTYKGALYSPSIYTIILTIQSVLIKENSTHKDSV